LLARIEATHRCEKEEIEKKNNEKDPKSVQNRLRQTVRRLKVDIERKSFTVIRLRSAKKFGETETKAKKGRKKSSQKCRDHRENSVIKSRRIHTLASRPWRSGVVPRKCARSTRFTSKLKKMENVLWDFGRLR
jgi:hypothetical protein